MDLTPQQAVAQLKRLASDLITEADLEKRLTKAAESKQPLRIKFGIDPTFTDVHIGHSVPIRVLRLFQRMGHMPILLLGDATARLGDPTGRNEQRPPLSEADVSHNAETYLDQIGTILDLSPEKCEIRRNSEWFGGMDFFDALRLLGRGTVARMLERDDFQKRMENRQPIHLHEMMYPLMQGWDSVMLNADVELGGNDQLFNLHMGRLLQERNEQRPQVCLTTPLLLGTDGRKMSKTYANHVPLNGTADDMYGKIMSLSDDIMPDWFRMVTELSDEEAAKWLAGHPRKAKGKLAWEVCREIHGNEAADGAAEEFTRRFKKKKLPQDIPSVALAAQALPLPNLMKDAGLCNSTSEARRLIKGGGVRLDGVVQSDPNAQIEVKGDVELLLQAGKRRFVKITAE
ncbi:MAG: tyrosine--tRNA ligase [Planctomycetes bacterium]|nr:tyrosine--tRNA ligase [Planctomycetota bacterium]